MDIFIERQLAEAGRLPIPPSARLDEPEAWEVEPDEEPEDNPRIPWPSCGE